MFTATELQDMDDDHGIWLGLQGIFCEANGEGNYPSIICN